MKNWSPNLKRDVAFSLLAIVVVLGIWSAAWEAPIWQPMVFYGLGIVLLVPAVANGREVGFEPLSNAIVAVISVGVMMIGAISYFVWEMFYH